MAGNTAPEIDPLATYDKRPAVSFDPSKEHGHAMGEWAILTVDGYVDTVQRKDDHQQPMVYSDTGKPMMSFVLPVIEDGEERALWGKVPGGPLTALKAAQAELQAATGDKTRRIRPGDTLAIRWASENRSVAPKMGNYPKVFEAKIKPGELPREGNTSADPFASAQPANGIAGMSTPAAQPAPQQPAAQPQQQVVPATPAPQVGGDPFGAPPAGEGGSQPAGDPFGAPPAQPAAAAPVQGDPFGAPQGEAPPF